MKTFKIFKLILITFLSITLINCNDNSNSSTPDGNASISVKLMDGPGDFDNVFVDVVGVEVKFESDTTENNWIPLEGVNTGVYDLLELTGGVNVLLADNYEIPAGTLKQIRLILGSDNSIVIDGETFSLATPSAQQSGLKIHVDQYLEPNINYTFLLDFDVDQSIVLAGNSGNINLVPVMRASVEANTGAVSGTVVPADFTAEVSTTYNGETITTYTDDSGMFLLVGLEPGVYDLTITPDVNTDYEPQTVEGVEVTAGSTTNIGNITFN